MIAGEIPSIFGGGRDFRGGTAAGGLGVARMRPYGPDFVIEAVGYDRAKPKVEAGPDPTGIQPLQQMWQPRVMTICFEPGCWRCLAGDVNVFC